MGSNMYIEDRDGHFYVFLGAAILATVPASVDALSTQEAANGLTTVTSQTSERPSCQGIKINPSGRFPSCLSSSEGSLTAGIPAATTARQLMSLRAWCLEFYPVPSGTPRRENLGRPLRFLSGSCVGRTD